MVMCDVIRWGLDWWVGKRLKSFVACRNFPATVAG